MKKKIRRGVTVLAVLALLISAGVLIWRLAERRQGLADYSEAQRVAGMDMAASGSASELSSGPQDPRAAQLMKLSLDALQEVNPDVIAWIDIPNTQLSYPILQAEDNQYYLNHTWKNKRNPIGGIFMESTNSPDFSGFHTILYGHRMTDDSMFGTLKFYSDLEYCEKHPRVYIRDGTGVYIYEVFAAYEANIQDIVYRLDIEAAGLQEEFIRFCLDSSVIDTGIVPTSAERILTLSTCTNTRQGYSPTRWIVQAVLREVQPLS